MKNCLLLIMCCFILLSACAVNQEVQVLRENDEKQTNKIEKNEKDIASLFVRMDEADTGSPANPELKQYYQDNQQLLQQIRQLNIKVENLQNDVRRLTEQAVRMQRIESEIESMKNAPAQAPVTATTPAPVAATSSMEEYHYQKAREAYVANDVNKAAEQFREFIRKYPDHQLAANSQYWLGECYYAMDNYTAARNEFLKVVDFYPKSPKVPDSLVKIALTYKQQGQIEQAKTELKRLQKLFPKYERMDLVRSLLKEM